MTPLRDLVRGADVRPEPWGNGAGVTRQLWRDPPNSELDFTWRLSLADLVADAPFSRYPGVDRVLLLLEGVDLHLSVDGRPRPLALRSPVRFDGESEVSVSAPTPGLALNLMTRRGLGADLRVRRVTRGHTWGSELRAVVVLDGRVGLDDGPVLKSLDVAVLDGELAAAEGTDASVAEVLVG